MTHALTDRPPLVARSTATDVDTTDDLLDHLGTDGFAWMDGELAFVTSGVAAVVAPEDAPAALRAIAYDPGDVHADARPRAVGALPFSGPGRLVIPSLIVGRGWRTTIEPASVTPPLRVARSRPSRFVVEACTGVDAWRGAVHDILASIARHDLDKVVLARAVRVQADEPFDVRRVLAELHRTQPGCTVYADGGFVGATPELLVAKAGRQVWSRPLAGTATRADQLARSEKDAREHEIVVEAVTDALRRIADDVRANGPAPIVLSDLTHLGTTVTAECRPSTSVVELVRALHPTPAVAGTPRAAALAKIDTLEPVARGQYAGPCGWVDADGDGAFVVALRCASIDGAVAVAHAGAGIVAGSDADAEWNETQQKLEPMLRALVRP